jgi:hypothetical protein
LLLSLVRLRPPQPVTAYCAQVSTCAECKTILARDASAAHVILAIFEFQVLNETIELPRWIKEG